jgi:hypothetical protein
MELAYNYHFDPGDHTGALACLSEYGFCVIRGVIGPAMVEQLKDSIDEHLDPERSLPPASSKYHMAFAEVCDPIWQLVDHRPYWNFIRVVLGSSDVCLHRSAAIIRTPGEGMGAWHTDHRGHIKKKTEANDYLNQVPLQGSLWFYLNGSDPYRSGIAVIEKSHRSDWKPKGFEFIKNRTSIRRIGTEADAGCTDMDVPGAVGVSAEQGDLICFSARTFHANMETNERRYSCGIGWRPKSYRIDAPWPLPQSAKALIERLPDRLKTYTDGYTGYDGDWRQAG